MRSETNHARRARSAAAARARAHAPRPAGSEPASPATPAKRSRNELVAAIAHDLRAPLASVTMGANFVLQTLGDDPAEARSKRILEAMLRSCTQMERLVRNFADLSEIEGGSVELRLGVHGTGAILELVRTSHEARARARSIALEVAAEHAPSIECDRERLLRAIGHLVDNAIAAAPDGSTVSVRVSERGDDVVFEVMDRGPGLDEETRRHLYDRTWHAKQAKRAGAGFGLSIARGFAEAHGGRIDVASRPGETRFAIALPKSRAAGPG